MIKTKRIFVFLTVYIIVILAFVKCASATTQTPITRTYNSGTIDRYEDDKAICYRTKERHLRSVSVSISCIKKD